MRMLAVLVLSSIAPVAASKSEAPASVPSAHPHIRFADGGVADFRGRDNALYSMHSAANVSLSMRTRDTTFWMPKDGKRQVVHGSYFTEAHLVLTDNGKVFYIQTDARKRGFVVKDRRKELLVDYDGETEQCFDKLVHASACIRHLTLSVTTTDWEFAITRRPIDNRMSGPSYYRLDVEIKRRTDGAVAHGIIGQSWDNDDVAFSGKTDDYSKDEVFTNAMAEGAIEGEASAYELKDEYHTGFKYSCFVGGKSKEVLALIGIRHACAVRDVSKLTGTKSAAKATSAMTTSDYYEAEPSSTSSAMDTVENRGLGETVSGQRKRKSHHAAA